MHGDGTSLWTLTHAEDFAQGLVGLLGNPRASGRSSTSPARTSTPGTRSTRSSPTRSASRPSSSTWPPSCSRWWRPDWFWSGEVLGDIGHTAVFDTSKIRRFVPGFAPKLTFHRAARRMVQWRADHPETTGADADDRCRPGPHRRAPTMRRGRSSPNALRSLLESARELAPPVCLGELGGTGLAVTPMCFGTSPLASMAQLYGYAVDEERAVATVSGRLRQPGQLPRHIERLRRGRHGRAPDRCGDPASRRAAAARRARHQGRPGSAYRRLLRGPRPRSLEESMERLGIDKIALLHLHDPERISFEEGSAPGGPVEALVDLRERGTRRPPGCRRGAGRAASAIP